jgi:hypothetical protein
MVELRSHVEKKQVEYHRTLGKVLAWRRRIEEVAATDSAIPPVCDCSVVDWACTYACSVQRQKRKDGLVSCSGQTISLKRQLSGGHVYTCIV